MSGTARWKTWIAALLLAAAALSCGGGARPGQPPGTAPAEGPVEGELLVFAASSLTDAFDALARSFRAAYPGVSVAFNYASSSALAVQINEGAPSDVFASASEAQMDVVTAAGNASNPRVFAANDLVIIVPAGTSRVTSLADLARPGLRLVLAGPDVPAGAYARQVLSNAAAAPAGPGADFAERVLANLRSNEANVRAVLTKVQLGEADAGVVYRTDAAAVGTDVTVIEIAATYNVVATYPVAATTGGENPRAAAAWIEFMLSAEGAAILEQFGFGQPR